jgi:hypothetical protein
MGPHENDPRERLHRRWNPVRRNQEDSFSNVEKKREEMRARSYRAVKILQNPKEKLLT